MMAGQTGWRVLAGQLIEYSFSQSCYLSRVGFLIAKAPAHGVHAAQAMIDDVGNGRPGFGFNLSQPID
jgi:hypothetical protein